MLGLGAESPAHVIETCAHRAALVFRGLVIDDDGADSESGPQRQAGHANERCLKAVRQSKSKLHSLFAVARDVDVNHHGCERGPLVQSAAIEIRPFRLNHGHERAPPHSRLLRCLVQRIARWKKPNFEMDQEWDLGPNRPKFLRNSRYCC
jgi:hypothetical protein